MTGGYERDVAHVAHNADTEAWIDEELASLRQSIERPGETVIPRAEAPQLRERARGSARSARRPSIPRMARGTLRHELSVRRFEIVTVLAALLSAIVVGLLIPLLLR